ncbi:unnamed protein product [Cochlearia groenlandica]
MRVPAINDHASCVSAILYILVLRKEIEFTEEEYEDWELTSLLIDKLASQSTFDKAISLTSMMNIERNPLPSWEDITSFKYQDGADFSEAFEILGIRMLHGWVVECYRRLHLCGLFLISIIHRHIEKFLFEAKTIDDIIDPRTREELFMTSAYNTITKKGFRLLKLHLGPHGHIKLGNSPFLLCFHHRFYPAFKVIGNWDSVLKLLT